MSLLSLFTALPSLITNVFGFLNKQADVGLEKLRVKDTNGKEVSTEALKTVTAGVEAQKQLNLSGMNHPIWWAAWALFVIPVGLHHAAVHFVSTFHLAWIVDKLPKESIEQDKWIILSIFGAQVTAGITKQITDTWSRRG